MHKIVIIQNTYYHFETTISLYQMLLNYGFDPYIYRCYKEPDSYKQQEILDLYNVKVVSGIEDHIWLCGFVVSAYPNPKMPIQSNIPNLENVLQTSLKNRLIYISHRFKNEQDYIGSVINRHNCLSLSALSMQIDVDYLYLTDSIISPNIQNSQNETIKLGIQGHFEFGHRNLTNIQDLLLQYNKSNILEFFLLGTNSKFAQSKLTEGSLVNCNIRCYAYEDISEIDFYTKLNSLHWLIPAIDPSIKNNTYSIERFSSSFNHALMLEKPIICHEFFKPIYKIPGLYYNNTNFAVIFDQLVSQSYHEYYQLVQEIKQTKNWMNIHNKKIIEKKMQYL